jgi:LuxR family transcriptional regulator, maltose regulon positive regulatory protein
MAKANAAQVKITRPRLPEILNRERLFSLLDRRLDNHPSLWIDGPPGSGKTTLATSYLDARALPCIWYALDESDSDIATFFYYLGQAVKKAAPCVRKPMPLLTPEYAFGVPVFTRRYIEELYHRIHRVSVPPGKGKEVGEFVIVFDNIHHLSEASPVLGVLHNAITIAPDGIRIIIISRNELPRELAALRSDKRLSILGWEELRLNLKETRDIVRKESGRKLSAKAIARIHDQAGGWAAGLVMMAKRAKTAEESSLAAGTLPHQELFDYVAAELFGKTDEQVQQFLIKTAVIPRVTPALAGKLTGADNADRILSELNRRNYFTEKRPGKELSYQYHPVFRNFLLMRGKSVLSPEEQNEIRRIAARHFEETGQAEDAVELYSSVQDWQNLTALILKHAAGLAAQGRSATLADWLSQLPLEIVERSPWLLYWMGISRFYISYSEGRKCLEQALHLFEARGDMLGAFSSWSVGVDTIIYEFGDLHVLDHWIARFHEVAGKAASFPSAETEYRAVSSMMSALLLSGKGAREIEPWVERAVRLMHACQDRNMRILTSVYITVYYLWTGDLNKMESLLQEQLQWGRASEITPMNRGTVHYASSVYQWITASSDFGMGEAAAGLAVSAAHGVHGADNHLLGMLLIGALNAGDLDAARKYHSRLISLNADTLQPYRFKYSYHHLTPWLMLAEDDYAGAHAQSLASLKMYDEAGGSSFHRMMNNTTAALALFSMGRHDETRLFIEEVGRIAGMMNSPLMEFSHLLLEAQRLLPAKDAPGRETLRKAMALGKARGYLNTIVWHAPAMTELCITALDCGIEIDYVRKLIQKRKLMPDAPPIHVDRWPWQFRITTLGGFGIAKDGKALTFSGRVPQKPLALLKALISLGGKDVREERLSDMLWPESQGDAAHSAFTTTLQRLRKIVGDENAVLVREGRVALDPNACWIDAAAFELLADRAEISWINAEQQGKHRDAASAAEAMALTDKALALYRGHFLPADDGEAWSISMRERLRSRFLRIITRKGKYLQQAGQWEKAADCFERALDVDDLAEELYQQLMICHQHTGRRAEAVVVYQRCCAVLQAFIGISPSQKTKAIFDSLKQ